jgi:amino acid adenylation domain-containing protein
MRFDHHLRESVIRNTGKTAIAAAGKRLSYLELAELSDALASALIALGVRKGDRVVVFLDNGWEAAVAIFAVWKAGAVLCPVNPSTKTARLAYIIGNCRAAATITQGRLAGVVTSALETTSTVQQVILTDANPALPQAAIFGDCLSANPLPLPTGLTDDDLATIIYTSGSTGEPKGVMMAHRNLDAAARSITTYLENTNNDIILSVLPMAFGYGLTQLLTAVLSGATLVLEKSFAFPYAVFERLRDEHATGFPLVPSMAAMLLQMRDLDPVMFTSLRYMTSAAAPLPVAHIEKMHAFLPRIRLYSMYGQTECIRATWLPPQELGRRPASVGIPIPGTTAQVVDEAVQKVAPGVTGELVISGPHVMRGYWEDEEATARALRPDPLTGDTRLHTGDLFRADAEGFLTFVARQDEIIKSRGEKVAPKEVEAVLYGLPGVVEALVVGVPDPVMGQAIKALVVSSNHSLSERDVIRHCARNLEDHMVPKSVEFHATLPKTDTGKLSRRLAAKPPQQ